MHVEFSPRQHRLTAILLTATLLFGGVAPALDLGFVGTASAASTSPEWSAPTSVTTAVATDGMGNVYVNDDGGDTLNDGIIRKYSPDGTQLYERTISNEPFNTLAASNSTLAVAASPSGFDAEPNSAYLMSLYPENGSVNWSKNGSDWGDVAVHDDLVVGLNRSGRTVEAFDAETGSREWSYSYTGSTTGGIDTLAVDHQRELVYLPVSDGQIHELYATNGSRSRAYTPPADVRRLLFDERNRRLLARYDSTGSVLGVLNVTDAAFVHETNVTLQGGTKGWAFDAYSETFYHGAYNGGIPKLWAYNLSDLGNPVHYDTLNTSFTPHSIAAYSTVGANTTLAIGTQSELHVYDSGQQAHAIPELASENSISGVVRTETGAPCRNCTVRVMAVNYSALDVAPDEYRERADELLARARNMTPDDWQSNPMLTGPDGRYATASAEFVAIHTESDWNPGTFLRSGVADLRKDPSLGTPRTHVPAGEPVVLSVHDPSRSPFYQDDIDEDLRGVTTSETIVVEQVGPGNSTLDEYHVETKPRITTIAGKTHEVARLSLDQGFYRLHPERSSVSVPLTVGDPREIASGYAADLRDRANRLSNHAKYVQGLRDQQTFAPLTATTDDEGRFSLSVTDANLKRAGVVAYRAPDGLKTDPRNVSLANIRTFYEETNTTASLYLPTDATTVDVPTSNVTVRVREASTPPFLSTGRYADLSALLADYLRNQSFADLPPALQQRLNNTTRDRLEPVYQRLDALAEQNDQLRDRYEALLRDQDKRTIDVTVGNATDADLRQRIQALRQSITELRDSLDIGNVGVRPGDDSVSSQATFDAPLSIEQVTVLGHWSNGTSFVVPEQYVSLDQHTVSDVGLRSTTVHVADYPLTASDSAALRFEYRVATPDDLGTASAQATNPSLDGDLPTLASIDLSTLEPGPNETVTVDANPESDSTFRRVTSATVYGPTGAAVATSNITHGDTFTFDTQGAGRYVVRVHIASTDGASVVETFRLTADLTNRNRPPSIRAVSGPTGTYALVGDGFEGGTVELSRSNTAISVVGQLPADARPPSTTHVYLSSVQPGREPDLSLRYVRGRDHRPLNWTVGVTIHSKAVSENALLYRGDSPITDEGTMYGEYDRRLNGTVVSTYTDTDGTVRVQTVNSPTFWEQAVYRIRTLFG
ncbi:MULTISPECIES: PQQ-binding-like beta-propeller repeat protein [Halorussus]|uniref:outer membrane protein assembly factor BamB family protein n=1 Tax=Halorussus TaxID=1070314 RepID=UPI0020A1ED35|nr:PQQ-binding-like beta-propeller repeat protein [Halorussus vallis]USZ78620.1 PQQ-binding-like beta-propeller repeat protein [Halorussus vallis]